MKALGFEPHSDVSHRNMKVVHAVLMLVAFAGEAGGELVRKNFFVNKTSIWKDAQTYCREYYVDLATVNTPWDYLKFEQDVPDHLLVQGWVGLSKRSFDPVYLQWSDGSILGIPLFKLGYPNNLGFYHCVNIYDMLLTDSDCGNEMPFFCYAWTPHMVLVKEMLTWKEALKYCRAHYTDLISVTTDKEVDSAKSTSVNSSTLTVWTGLRFMDGSWFWVNKVPLGNLTSVPPCPMNPYRCGALKAGGEDWENRDCDEKMNFLCLY